MTVDALLQDIAAEYERHGAKDLQPITPATESALAVFEESLGQPLPEEFRSFLQANRVMHPFEANFMCLDLEGVVRTWKLMTGLLDEGTFDDGRVEQRKPNGNWNDGKLREVFRRKTFGA